ncbi:MAG: hypothetical protein J7L15_02900 [Clostridiales bacterium]|nr:hypothetical protein [Clostridiales bacterium]
MCLLSVEAERAHYDKLEDLERHFKNKMGISILPKNINDCKYEFKIEKKKDIVNGVLKTQIRPSLLTKGIGHKAAIEIEKNQPYKNVDELAEKTGSIVDTRVVDALAENGFLGGNKGKKNKENIVEKFIMVRNDMKLAAKKGVEKLDIFK